MTFNKNRKDKDWQQAWCAKASMTDNSCQIPFELKNVKRIKFAYVSYGDCNETAIEFICKLKNGKYGYVSAGCDTTGWDCRSSANGKILNTIQEAYLELSRSARED